MFQKSERYGSFGLISKITNVLCEDGKLRTVHFRGVYGAQADTWFSCPGIVYANGKTVSGYVSFTDGVQVFHTILGRVNADSIVRRFTFNVIEVSPNEEFLYILGCDKHHMFEGEGITKLSIKDGSISHEMGFAADHDVMDIYAIFRKYVEKQNQGA